MTTQEERSAALESAIKRGGGIIAFSKSLNVTHQATSAWRKRGHVPFDKAAQIERMYGVPRATLVSQRIADAFLMPSSNDEDVL